MARQIVFYGNVSNREDTMRLVVAFTKRSTFARIYQLLVQICHHIDATCNLDDISCQFE